MLKATDVFTNEVEQVKEAINGIAIVGCIEKYSNYVDQYAGDVKGFEKGYIIKLQKRRDGFVARLKARHLKDKTAEELLKIIEEHYKDGVYSVEDDIANNGSCEVLYNYFSDSDVYTDIFKELVDTFNELVDEIKRTTKEREILGIENNIKSLRNSNESLSSTVKANIERIMMLEDKLKDLK